MKSLFAVFVVVFALAGCVSGDAPVDSYTDRGGTTTQFRTDREACVQACNEDYERCMEIDSSQGSPVHAPSDMFGTSGTCHSSLKDCLPACKGR